MPNRLEGIVAASDKRLRELIAARAEPGDHTEGKIEGYRNMLDTIHQASAAARFRTSDTAN